MKFQDMIWSDGKVFPFFKKMSVLIQIQKRANSIIYEHLDSMIGSVQLNLT